MHSIIPKRRLFWYNVGNHPKMEKQMKKLEGLIAAAHTPFNKDGSINYDLVAKQAQTLIKQKVTGVYVSGTTGEGICCSVAERKQVLTHGSRRRKESSS